eukprot:2777145-Rhodomonas_salina.5
MGLVGSAVSITTRRGCNKTSAQLHKLQLGIVYAARGCGRKVSCIWGSVPQIVTRQVAVLSFELTFFCGINSACYPKS